LLEFPFFGLELKGLANPLFDVLEAVEKTILLARRLLMLLRINACSVEKISPTPSKIDVKLSERKETS
jgi:hypothetical protein